MVGDDVETDVGGAIEAGLAGILVRTGKYREEFVAQSGRGADGALQTRSRTCPGCSDSSLDGPWKRDVTDLDRITERLESLARELDSGPEEQRAAELVREASELAAEAGQAVDRALRARSPVRARCAGPRRP